MPRIGTNPNRGLQSGYKPARVTLAVLTYLPEEIGYFQTRFDVTRLCIESLLANTPEPFDLLVFDNGSCAHLVDYLRGLHDAGQIDYLILSSRNIGKIGALRQIFNFAPGEIVAYTDDDIFFEPGWLDAHLQIIDTYPDAGMVTGFYVRPRAHYGVESVRKFAEGLDVTSEHGLLIPREWEQEYIDNANRTWESYTAEIAGIEDTALTYHGVSALVSAHHFQFVAPRRVILDALPAEWTGHLMGQMQQLDADVDRLGFLRLTTRQRTVRLMGNLIPDEVAAQASALGIQARTVAAPPKSGFLSALKRTRYGKRLMQEIYNRLYQALFGDR